jgi:branched-chain amino acid transport system permease protein
MAIREDELAASANGINTVVTKLLAFALGATTSGFAGVVNASKLTIVSPDQFQFTVSFTVLAMVIIGGMGNIWAAAAGAFIVYITQVVLLRQLSDVTEGLRDLGFPVIGGPGQLMHLDISQIRFQDYQYLLFGIVLVLMMLKRPEGLFPSRTRKAELHTEEQLGEDNPGVMGSVGEAPG